MFQRSKPRRFRRRPTGRHHSQHGNGHSQTRLGPSSFSNGQNRNNFRPTQSAEKLYEKYSGLAKEAMTSGEKTLGENYLQHADHFLRLINEKNKNKEQTKTEIDDKSVVDSKPSTENNNTQEKDIVENKK